MNSSLKIIISSVLLLNSVSAVALKDNNCTDLFYSSMHLLPLPSASGEILTQDLLKSSVAISQTQSLDIMSFIKTQGIDKFIIESLNGQFPYEQNFAGLKTNLFDLAIIFNAKPETVKRLKDISLTPTASSFVLQIRAKSITTLVKEYTGFGVDMDAIRIPHNEKQLSLLNYLIINNKLPAITALLNQNLVHHSNAYTGDLIDLEKMDFKSMAEIAPVIDVVKYKKVYTVANLAVEKRNSTRQLLKRQYQDHYLAELCIDKKSSLDIHKKIKPDQVLFAYTRDEISELLAQYDLTLESEFEKITSLIKHPLIIDHIAKIQHDKSLSTIRFVGKEKRKVNPAQVNIVRRTGLTLKEQSYLASEITWADDKRLRLAEIAKYLADNDSIALRDKIKKDKGLKNSFYLGKNFTFYLMLFSDDITLLKWGIKNVAEPEALYGANILESLKIKSLYYPLTLEKMKLLKRHPNIDQQLKQLFELLKSS